LTPPAPSADKLAMHSDMKSLIKSLGGVGEVARLIGVKRATAAKWYSGRVPVDYWPDLIGLAHELGVEGVSADTLMRLHLKPKHARRKHLTARDPAS
jgi:hypothetical protein